MQQFREPNRQLLRELLTLSVISRRSGQHALAARGGAMFSMSFERHDEIEHRLFDARAPMMDPAAA